MLLETLSTRWFRARRTNTTDASFPSRIPTLTKPSGQGNAVAQTTSSVFSLRGDGLLVQNGIKLMPYGAGGNNATLSVRVYGWALAQDHPTWPANSSAPVWMPTLLVELACTLDDTFIGPAGGIVLATDLFADTITIATGNAGVSVDVVSPTGSVGAHAVLDFKGFDLFEPVFSTGGSATNGNALWAVM